MGLVGKMNYMKRLLLVLGLCFFKVNAFSQGSTNLILKYRGLQDEVLVTAYVMACTATDNSDENIGRAYDHYYAHEDEIIAQYDAACFLQYLERLSEVRAVNREATYQAISQMAAGFAQAAADYRQKREIEEQQEQQIKMQKRAEMQARMANSPDRRPQAISNYKTQNSGYNNSAYRTQGSYNDLLTSDPNWNQQVQMMVQQYGVEKTREIVRQKRSNDISRQAEINNTYKSYNERVSQSSGQERIVTGVTENGQTIQLKIKGENIVAYSTGLNYSQQQNWTGVYMITYSSCKMSGAAFLNQNLVKQYAYYASINNTRVYFNL